MELSHTFTNLLFFPPNKLNEVTTLLPWKLHVQYMYIPIQFPPLMGRRWSNNARVEPHTLSPSFCIKEEAGESELHFPSF